MNLSAALERAAAKQGEKAAYYFLNETSTYEELNKAVHKFASGLKALGIQKGDHIALIVGNSPEFIIGLYGALRAGATVIPVNPLYSPGEMSYILQNGDAKAVIMLDVLVPLADKIAEALPFVEHYIICETKDERTKEASPELFSICRKMKTFSSVLDKGLPSFQPPDVSEEDTAVILYTSGTTGKPKGAMLTHKNLYSNARDIGSYLQFSDKDRIITALPMFHVFCLSVCLNAPLISGATMIIFPKFSPRAVFAQARQHKATVFAGVPTMYNFLYQSDEGHPEDFASLRLCISGGSSMPVALLENFEEKFRVKISEGYGLSEASPVAAFNPLDRPRKAGSIGCSIMNVENKVVNEQGEELPPGEVGELIVRGPNVMKGYYKQPEYTAAALKNGWLYTGDLARKDEEGYFYIVDRKKDLIIVGGYNVYPREVEEVLYSHPYVIEAAVFGVPDPDYGEAVLAFVVPKDEKLTKEELLDYCHSRLADYKLPAQVEFLEELPKNTTGKILRRALKQQVLQR
ncbi:fatty acid--CoA ligase family protein [Pseudobacillus badius]|uniref:fatty acid--CoA ligase family protein n=1 Tax=Bacillus badius TaxID=1455 RepID=UPI0007B099B3|nr:fatty acid--CoA ligase family protein [Bacillus badius]KZO01191.1 long-chain fatty acid--CoA ligase [Bacillus badius]OCS89370.1 long-chain fatty acid--CoA ligase [Bacillus badius]OVE51251.1 long-chain fatty acid--CoA ligase [Bacillus badius]TDW02244.1 long-chain acyl-CoA synthetase [Bacillus badius]